MMPRRHDRKPNAPRLELVITQEQRQRAIESNSGACLIADAIKSQYPNLTSVSVDMATIRATDRARGLRFTWLTPAAAQHVLLSFDQGWPNPIEHILITHAVKIDRIVAESRSRRLAREERLAKLREKRDSGETLTSHEKTALTQMEQSPHRSTSEGPTEVVMSGRTPVIHGGKPIPQGPAHPNLLRGRNRIFGAKLADPGRAFEAAVNAEVAKRQEDAS